MSFHPTKLNLYHAFINNPENGSRVRFGQNAVIGLFNAGKKTQGYGQQLADEVKVVQPESLMDERDISDSNSHKGLRS